MTRAQWIQKLQLLDRLVDCGDITEKLRVQVVSELIDKERQEWDREELQRITSTTDEE